MSENPLNTSVYDEQKLAQGLKLLKYVSYYFFASTILLGVYSVAIFTISSVFIAVLAASLNVSPTAFIIIVAVFCLAGIAFNAYIYYYIKTRRTVVGKGAAIFKLGIALLILYILGAINASGTALLISCLQIVAATVTIYAAYLKKTNEPAA